MGPVRTALKLRMELYPHIEVISGNLNSLHYLVVRGSSGKDESLALHHLSELIVELIAVTMALCNLFPAVTLSDNSTLFKNAGICTEP